MRHSLDELTEEAKGLFPFLNNHPDLCGVEVGVLRGKLSSLLLAKFPGLYLTMVDNWNVEGIVEDSPEEVKRAAIRNTEFAAARRRMIEKPSVEAAREVQDASQDFVYIDALHDYASVKADVEAWWPKVRSGGILGGHDYGRTQADRAPHSFAEVLKNWGVARAVHEFCIKQDLHLESVAHHTWIVRKP